MSFLPERRDRPIERGRGKLCLFPLRNDEPTLAQRDKSEFFEHRERENKLLLAEAACA